MLIKRRCKFSHPRRPVSPNIAGVPPKNKKVVHLGTIVDDLEGPTWHRKKSGSDDLESVTHNKNNFQSSANQEDDDKYDIPTFLRRQMD